MIRNLGQVAAIYIGSSAPRNTNLIWLDNTVVPFVFRAYDGSAWSEIATHKWVRAYVDGWLVTLPPRQLADDGDYMLINSNNVNYKITVKDFVKSAVGNPLDFKGVIRVSADFPNPSTLESGDMYVIITSPAGRTVTDPYSGKTFEDSEKIVWDEVTQSWESLGKIDITVDLTTSYSETEVTIHSSAGKETTIQGATDQLAGVMLPGQYSWLQALSNGSIVPGDPSPLTPLTPAHKHNYSDIVNRLVSQQGTGESTIDPMSQKATTDALNLKFDKASVLQVSGTATDKVMSQKAVTDALKTLSDDFNNKLTNYLPLVGGTMKGSIRFPAESGIIGNADGTRDTYILRSFNNRLDIGSAALSTRIISNASDLLHHRSDTSYKIWDAYNLPDPATLSGNNVFTGNNTFQAGKFNVGPFEVTSSGSLLSNINTPAGSAWSRSLVFRANNDIPSSLVFGGYNSVDNTSIGYVYIGIGDINYQTAQYKFYANSLRVPYQWSIDGPDGSAILWSQTSEIVNLGRAAGTTKIRSGNTDLIHTKGSTEYIIWDKSNLPNPVRYALDASNYPTLLDSNGSSFSYIKAGTNGLLPHSQVTLANGGSGSLGTSDRSFNVAYINNLHTNKVTFGDTGSFIDNQSGDSSHIGIGFYTSQNVACPVYVGSLCVSDVYANSAPNIPTNGIYSKGIIYIENGIGFRNSIWTNDLTPNRNYSGYLQVLDAYDAANAGGPTNHGTVLQVNSRNAHWANQLWFGSNDNMYLRRMNYGSTTYGEWNRLLTNKDVNIIQRQSSSNPSTLPVNQIFYSEIQKVTGTPTDQGALFSVQGDDEGIQLWASSSKTKLYYRTKWTSFGNWIKLVTEFDLNSYLTKTEASTLYYPYNGRGYLSITSTGKPVMSNNQGYAVKDKDGNEREVLWMGTNNALYLGNTSQYTLGQLDLRCTTLTHNGSSIATQNYVTNQLSNYLPLSGGTLSGNLTINTVGSTTFVINNNDTNGSETFMRVLRKGTASAAVGFRDSLGAYIYNYNSNKYLFIDNDGYARVGTTSGSTRLALITDIPTVSGYLPLTGGTLTGALTMSSRRHGVVIDVIGGAGNTWDEGVGALSVQVPNDAGQTPLLLARRSGAAIDTTTAAERLLSMELLDDGHSFIIGMSGSKALQLNWTSGRVGTGKLFGKTIATTDQIPSIPSISISNSGSGNAVTAISASGHTLTVTKGATYLTSSSLDGYATQSWVNNQGYLTSHQTIYNLTFQAGTFAAKTFDPNGAAATVNIPTNTSHLTNDSGFITSSALNGYATQAWVNSQNFVKSTSTKKVTDIQPVDALPATQVSGVLYLVFG